MTWTPELVAALFGGLAALLTAIAAVIMQLRQVHRAVNSRLDAALARIEALQDAAKGDSGL